MILSEEVLKESSTYRWIVEQGLKRGLAEGRAMGLQEGREEGRKAGRAEGLRQAVESLLTTRFGDLPASARTRLKSAKPERLARWLKQAINAPTLKDALK